MNEQPSKPVAPKPVAQPVPQLGRHEPLLIPQFPPKLLAAFSRKPSLLALALGAVAVLGVPILFPASGEMTEEARLAAFEAAGPLPLPTVNLADPAERQEALHSMNLNPVQAEQWQTDLTQRGGRLVWLDVLDDHQEDGDIVAIRTFSFSQEIPIFHAPHRVAVPLSPEERGIALTGVYDGGGGITVAVRVDGRFVPLPRLQPGQTIAIPIL